MKVIKDLKEVHEELRTLTIQHKLLGEDPCLFKLKLEAMDRGLLPIRKKSV